MSRFEMGGGAQYPAQFDLIDYGPLTADQFAQGYAATQGAYAAGWEASNGSALDDASALLEQMRETHPDFYGRCVVEMGDPVNGIQPYL